MPVWCLTYLPTYLPCLTYLPTYLPTYPLTYLPTYLPTTSVVLTFTQADIGGGTTALVLSLADLTITPLLLWTDGRCPDAVCTLH